MKKHGQLCSSAYVCMIKKGERIPSEYFIYVVCYILKLDPDEYVLRVMAEKHPDQEIADILNGAADVAKKIAERRKALKQLAANNTEEQK